MFDGRGLPLAVNVKAAGWRRNSPRRSAAANIPWFAFDMSGPETVRYAGSEPPFLYPPQ